MDRLPRVRTPALGAAAVAGFRWLVRVLAALLLATVPAIASDWQFRERQGEDWCLVQHADGDIQLWFGTYYDGSRVVTVDVRQTLARASLFVDDIEFAVESNPRGDAPEFRELELAGDVDAFLSAAARGTVLRAGTRYAPLEGLGEILRGRELRTCLSNVGWPDEKLPLEHVDVDREGLVLSGVIYIAGEIDRDFALALERARAAAGKEPTVIVGDSPGGSLWYAERAARALREAEASVLVEGDCASACVSVMAGGMERSLGPNGRLGLHRPVFIGDADADDGQAAVAEAADFFREMGVSIEVALIEASIPSDEMHWLTGEEASRLALVTD